MALYKEQLRPAAFRGVPFFVTSAEQTAGRRTQLHEYPLRDKPLAQDMGRATRFPRFQAFVIGSDFVSEAKRLIEALEQPGAGELVHPLLGSMTVSVLEPASVVFDEELGKATFQLSFVEAGELANPQASTATQAVTRTAASGLLTQTAGLFGKVFQTIGYVNQVAQTALAVYGVAQSVIRNPLAFGLRLFGLNSTWGNLQSLYGIFSNPAGLGRATNARINAASFAASGAFPTDAAVATAVNGLRLAAIHPALADPLGRSCLHAASAAIPFIPAGMTAENARVQSQYLGKLAGYASASDLQTSPAGWQSCPPLPHSASVTPVNGQAYANAAMQMQQVRLALLANAAALTSLHSCAVYDDATGLRDQLCHALGQESLALSDFARVIPIGDAARTATGQDATPSPLAALEAVQTALADMRAAVWADLTLRSRDSARLKTVTLTESTPALVLAYDLYADANRQTEIIARNRVARPLFIPPSTIKVLAA